MLRTRLARLGKRIKLLDEWVEDKEACAERIAAETALTHGVRPPAAAVKDVILAAINGASVEKWVSSKWGIPHAPLTLARFARYLATVRANAHIWFPEIWSDVDAKRSDSRTGLGKVEKRKANSASIRPRASLGKVEKSGARKRPRRRQPTTAKLQNRQKGSKYATAKLALNIVELRQLHRSTPPS
ncbi:MAG: hypothetical protein VX650_09670 [Actinomycetota bacterium]|nr:hypothetical protein [Actinomycetota bacterium]